MSPPIRPDTTDPVASYLQKYGKGGSVTSDTGDPVASYLAKYGRGTGANDTPGDIDLRQLSDTTRAGKPRHVQPSVQGSDDTPSGFLGTLQKGSEAIASGLPGGRGLVALGSGLADLAMGKGYDTALANANESLKTQQQDVASLPRSARIPLQLLGGAPAAAAVAPLGVVGGGAALGAASGLEQDANSTTDRLYHTAVGAGLGALGAKGTQMVGRGLVNQATKHGVTDWIADKVAKVSPDLADSILEGADEIRHGKMYQMLRDRIEGSGTTPGEIRNEVAANTAASGAKPEVLGDYAPGVARLTKTLSKRPDAAQSMILPVLEDRAANTRGRVLQDLTQGGNVAASDPAAAAAPDLPSTPPAAPTRPAAPISPAPGVRDRVAGALQRIAGLGQQDVRQSAEQAVQARANTASELFPQAYASEATIDTPESQEMLQRPVMQKLFGRAQEAAANRGETLPMATERRLNETAQALLTEAKPQDAPALQQRLLSIPGFSEDVQRPVLNARSMHYMDVALRQAENGFESENGISRAAAGDARQILGQLRPMRDASLPALAEAQNTYADQSGPIRAYDQGLNFLKTLTSTKAPEGAIGQGDPVALKSFRTGIDGLEQSVQNMAPEDLPRFRQAAQQALLEHIQNTPASASGSTSGVLRGVLADTPLGARARSLLFDSPEQLAQFQDAIGGEHAGLANFRQAQAAYPAQREQYGAALQKVRQEATLIRQSNAGNQGAQGTLASRMPEGDATLRRLRMNDQVQTVNSVPATATGSTIPTLRRAFPDSPVDESRVRGLFPSQETADRFMHALNRERNMAATTGAMGGSDTFSNAAENDALSPKSIVGGLHRPQSWIGKGVDWWQDRQVHQLANDLGPAVSANTPEAITDLLLRLERTPGPFGRAASINLGAQAAR